MHHENQGVLKLTMSPYWRIWRAKQITWANLSS